MLDVMSRLSMLHRPRLLVRTARIGKSIYSRKRDLRRILGYGNLPRPAAAIIRLLDLEYEINQHRLVGDAGYALTRHIEVLTALMGEADYLAAHSDAPDQEVPDAVTGTVAPSTTAPQLSPYASASTPTEVP